MKKVCLLFVKESRISHSFPKESFISTNLFPGWSEDDMQTGLLILCSLMCPVILKLRFWMAAVTRSSIHLTGLIPVSIYLT